jgi:hypothetical protein
MQIYYKNKSNSFGIFNYRTYICTYIKRDIYPELV